MHQHPSDVAQRLARQAQQHRGAHEARAVVDAQAQLRDGEGGEEDEEEHVPR